MTDEQTIEAIRQKNVWRRDAIIERGEMGDYDPSLDEASQDIDTLLSEIEARDAEIERLRTEVAADDKLLAERNRILEAHPCPVHGPCVPYVLNTIKRQDGDCDE